MLPARTRTIELAFDFRRPNGGVSTDAVAGNASLVVVPEPGLASGLITGAACFAWVSVRPWTPRRR